MSFTEGIRVCGLLALDDSFNIELIEPQAGVNEPFWGLNP